LQYSINKINQFDMNYSKIIIILVFSISSIIAEAQIGGLSASKIASFSVGTVPSHKIEFEPSFQHLKSKYYWDNDNNKHSIFSTTDSVRNISAMSFRFSYGITNKLEFGVSVSPDVSMSNWGLRYVLLNNNKLGIAAITGMNIPLGNQAIDKKVRLAENLLSIGLGGVMSYNFSDNFSADFTAQYQFHLDETTQHDKNAAFLNLDFGYYIFKHQLQIASGFAYRTVQDDNGGHKVFTISPGITIETGETFIIVLYAPFDVIGKNEVANHGFGFALTILLN
jgi:hypothetical protein